MKINARMPIVAASIGFACFLAMNSFSLWGFSYLPEFVMGAHADKAWSLPLALSNTAAFLVFVIAASKNKAKHPPLAGAVGFVACGLICLLGFLGSENLPLLFLSGGCVGVGTTCCFVCWETVFSRMGDRQRKLCILAGSVLSAASFAFFATADNSLTLFAIMVLAFGSIATMYFCLKAIPEKQENLPFALNAKSLKEYAGLLLCILAIGVISPVIDEAMPNEGSNLMGRGFIVHGANVLSAIVLGVAWFAFDKAITIKRAYYLVFPLFVTALFLFPFVSDEMKQAASFAASFGFTFFSIVMMISCIEISEEKHEGLIGLYALFAFVTYASRFVGDGVSFVLGQSSIPNDTLPMAAAFLLVYLLSIVMFLVSRKSRHEATPLQSPDTQAEQPHRDIEDRAERQCAILAEQYKLTERQHEILVLFSHGYDIPSIAKRLFISENTVRTHTKKLYLVLDVHSKQEIISLIETVDLDSEA